MTPKRKITRRRLLKLAGATLGAAGLGAFYAFRIEPIWLQTVDVEVPIRGLPSEFHGFRIVQLSDLHVGAGVPASLIEDAVECANESRPDVIVVTGDFIHHASAGRHAKTAAQLLERLTAPAGVFGVIGNHDVGVYHPEGSSGAAGRESRRRVCEELGARGLRILENETHRLERRGARLRLTGVGDYWADRFDPAAAGLLDRGDPTVVLCHNPDAIEPLETYSGDLVLSGHTHGGQVQVPFLGAPILPVVHRERYAGLYRVGEKWLYINRGVGWIRRVRLFARPEVTVVTLVTA
jgi:hypothetical protein